MNDKKAEWVIGVLLAAALMAVPFLGLRNRYSTERAAVVSVVSREHLDSMRQVQIAVAEASDRKLAAGPHIWVLGLSKQDVDIVRFKGVEPTTSWVIFREALGGDDKIDFLAEVASAPKSDMVFVGFRPLQVQWFDTVAGRVGVVIYSGEPPRYRVDDSDTWTSSDDGQKGRELVAEIRKGETAMRVFKPSPTQGNVTDEEEEQWCEARRNDVAEYLLREGVEHGEIGDWPAWHVFPYVSIWAIESKRAPDHVGWWAIAGDLPTDYVSAESVKHPRDAVRAFADRWTSLSEDLANGRSNDAMRIGKPEDWPKLAPLLKARAGVLRGYADDDRIWQDL